MSSKSAQSVVAVLGLATTRTITRDFSTTFLAAASSPSQTTPQNPRRHHPASTTSSCVSACRHEPFATDRFLRSTFSDHSSQFDLRSDLTTIESVAAASPAVTASRLNAAYSSVHSASQQQCFELTGYCRLQEHRLAVDGGVKAWPLRPGGMVKYIVLRESARHRRPQHGLRLDMTWQSRSDARGQRVGLFGNGRLLCD